MLTEYPSRHGQRGDNCRAEFTIPATQVSRPIKQDNSSGTGGSQHQNMLYTLQDLHDQEGSPDIVIGTSQVFDLEVYALLDLGVILSFVTPYITV